MTILCPGCGSENEAQRRFCNACGVSLEVLCPCCGFSNRVGDQWCGGCGVRLAQVLAPAGALPAGGEGRTAAAGGGAATPAEVSVDQSKRDELRTITVMMADLEGFAEMTDGHGREKQTAVMNEVFEQLARQHIVEEFDGYIDKFLDGDIMALFGAPIAHEDAPERALRAAVRMHAELTRLHDEGVIPADTPLKLRIGINTGPVRVGGVGAGGRMEYTAMGDTVNLAARLMTACAWGQSLISVNTHRRVAGSFELAELEPVQVKGKSQPVKIWAVLAERRRAARVELAQAAGMSRLVGRQAQLDTVLGAWQRALAGRGGSLGICGEAGIGKSRLVFELQQRVAGSEARCIEGRCVSYGANTLYLPIRDLLNELCQIQDADSAEVRREKVTATLAAVGLAPAEHGPPLGFVLGLDFADREFNQLDPQERRQRLRGSTLAVVEAASRAHPLVVFLDDLQWCDAASLEIVEDLLERCPELRLLVLLAYRPDFTADLTGRAGFQLVQPSRLTVDETREVVGSLLKSRGQIEDEQRIDASLAEAVYRKSQGNPFFIDQTVTALIERAEQSGKPTIDVRRGRLLISEDELGSLVPDSVEEILLARIDKLPEAPRALLQAASVALIGRYFRRTALQFVAGEEGLDELLGVLEQRDLIRVEHRGESDVEYVFEHALSRDVAYNNLLRAERRRLHGLVGQYIEGHYASSLSAYTDDLAWHFYNSANAPRALHYLPQSAARAASTYANQQAVTQYKRALEKADEIGRDGGPEDLPRQRLELLKGLTGVLALTGDKDALDFGVQRLELARELHDRDGIIDASYMLAHQYTASGQFEEAQAAWTWVQAEYEAAGAWDGVRDTEYGIGNLGYLQGRYEDARQHFQRALDIQTEHLEFEPFGLWVSHNNLAAAYDAMGRFSEMLESCRVCGEMLEKLAPDDPMKLRLECYTSGNLGSAHRNLGNLAEAVTAYERTIEITRSTGEKNVEAEARHWLGRTQLLLGRLQEAPVQLDEALALARETGSTRWEAGSLAGLAEAALAVGDTTVADRFVAQGRALCETAGELAGALDLGVAGAHLELAHGHAEAAVAQLQSALESAHHPAERAIVLAELAAAALADGDPARAGQQAEEALAIATRLEFKPILVRALRVRAAVRRAGDAAGAATDAAAALTAATEMGALEEQIAALALQARLLAHHDRAAARATLDEAEARLTAAASAAGLPYVTAARERHLAPLLGSLA
ncbi:MAG: AAA family ATPase [Fimbriimonadaceae bacterium]|nr:AAA family ATPase [Fimbriimonadaceae bacterium]